VGTEESRLIVRLLDGATGPATKIAKSLNFMRRTADRVSGATIMPGGLVNAGAVSRTLRNMAIVTAGYVGLRGGIETTIGEARRMQAALTEIGIKGDLSKWQVAALGKQLTALSPQVNQATADLVKGVDAMVTLGLDTDRAVAAMPAIGRAATATMSSVDDLSAASVAAMQNFGVMPAEIEKMLDAMTEAGNQGAFEVRDMAREFPALTASAKSLGIEGVKGITDMSAALQIARRGAGDASTAANNMANFLQKIMSPRVIKNFKTFGIDATKELQKAHKKGISPIEHFIGLVDKATKGGRADLLGQLFGDKQVLEFVRPMLADFKDYLKIRDDAERASGTAARAYAQRMQDAEQRIKALRIQVENLGRAAGNRFLQPIGDFAGHMASVLDTLDKRVTIFDKFWAAANGLAKGLGFKDAEAGLIRIGSLLEEGIFGKIDYQAGERLGRIFKQFEDWGKAVRSFSDAIVDNPIGRFAGQVASYGFQLMLASAAISMLASSMLKLGRAAAFLSGLTAAAGIIKGLAKVGGWISNASRVTAATGTTGTAASAGKGTGASVAATGAAKAASKAGGSTATSALDALVSSGRTSTQLTVSEKALGKAAAITGLLGRAAGRMLGWPSIAAEVTARALIEKGPADIRFYDPNFAPWALRHVEDKQAGREPSSPHAPQESEPQPFSFSQLWKDLTQPIQPVVDTDAINEFADKADQVGQKAQEALSITARPGVDSSSIDQANSKVQRFLELFGKIGGVTLPSISVQGGSGATPNVPEPNADLPRRAAGGVVRRGLTYEINEKGTETVTMGVNGYVTPAHRVGPVSDSQAVAPSTPMVEHKTTVQVGPVHIHGANADEVLAKLGRTLNRALSRSRQLSLDGRPVTT